MKFDKKYFPHYKILFVLLLVLFVSFTVNMVRMYQAENDHNRAQIARDNQNSSVFDATLKRLSDQKAATAKKAADKIKAEERVKQSLESSSVNPPAAMSAVLGTTHNDPTAIDVLVNKKHPLSPLNFTPELQAVSCSGSSGQLRTEAVAEFVTLCAAAAAANVPIGLSSSFRSYDTQVSTYNYWVSQSGTAGADTYSARPGYSEHQTGLAMDVRVPGGAELSDFTGSAQQQWMAAHAHEYGFIQRYTESNSAETGYTAESWHFRYVGRSIAAAYSASYANSLESYWGVSGGGY